MRSKSADLPGRRRRSAILGRQRSPETAARPKPQNRSIVRRGLAPSRPDMCRFVFAAADYIASRRRRGCAAVSQRGGGVEGGEDLGDAQPAQHCQPPLKGRPGGGIVPHLWIVGYGRWCYLPPPDRMRVFCPTRMRGAARAAHGTARNSAKICPPEFASCRRTPSVHVTIRSDEQINSSSVLRTGHVRRAV